MKKLAVFAVMFLSGLAISGPIHTWVAGEYITYTDLNANLQHLHNNLGHGHGPVLVNADINTSAAIAHTKMATPALLPKAWAYVAAACATPAACTLSDSSGITSIAGQATTGEYLVTFTARANANYAVVVSAFLAAQDSSCHATAQTTTTVTIKCITASTGADLDSGFSFLLLDTE